MERFFDDPVETQHSVMYVDAASNKSLLLIGGLLGSVLLIAIIIGAAGPSTVFDSDSMLSYQCKNNSVDWDPNNCEGWHLNNNKTIWHGDVTGLGDLHQFWSLGMEVGNPLAKVREVKDFKVSVALWAREHNKQEWQVLETNDEHSIDLTCPKDEAWCDSVTLVFELFLHYPDYRVAVNFPDDRSQIQWIGDVNFTFTVVNPSFSSMALAFRVIGFTAVVIMCVVFMRRLGGPSPSSVALWTYEQKWTTLLLLSLLFYCNPIVPFDLALHNWFFSVLSSLFETIYSLNLLNFLLCMFDRFRSRPQPIDMKWFYGPKLAVLSVVGLVQVSATMAYNLSLNADPVAAWTGTPFITKVNRAVVAMHMAILVWVVILFVLAAQTVRWQRERAQRYVFLAVPTMVLVVSLFAGLLADVSPGRVGRSPVQFAYYFALHNVFCVLTVIGYWPLDHPDFEIEDEALAASGSTNAKYASTANPFA